MKITPTDMPDISKITVKDLVDYIKNDICDGDEEQFRAFVRWLVQPPAKDWLEKLNRWYAERKGGDA